MPNLENNRVTPVVSSIPQEAWIEEPSRSERRAIIREFALNTSTHGLPGIARSESKHNCIFWAISFLIFLGIMIFFVTESIQNYFQYPTQTSVSIVVERSQAFPAVTFCNYAPARYDQIIVPFLNYTNSLNITNTNDTTVFTFQQAVVLRQYLVEQLNAGQSIDNVFFSIDIMLINCTYNGQLCTSDDFITFLSSAYGRCYTFNAKTKNSNGSNLRYTNDYGGSGKLQLRLYAHNHLYIPYTTEDVSSGIVAMIHDNTQLPQVEVASIELAPGRKHKLGYKRTTNYFLSSPYTDCTTDVPLVMQAMYDHYEGADYEYSQSVCYTLCIQAYIYQQCQCVSPFQWTARSVVFPNTNTITEAPLCSLTDSCYSDAFIRISNTSTIWDEYCSNCKQECSTVNFLVTPSSVSAPSMLYAYMTKGFVESISVPLPSDWSTNWLAHIQQNYVSFDVVCESNRVDNYTQEASVDAVSVLSDVGGQSGLWIGISFLSIMEFIEMIYRVIRYEFRIILRTIRNKFRTNTI